MGGGASHARRSTPAATPARAPPRVTSASPPVSRTEAPPIAYSSMLDQSYSSMDDGGYCGTDGEYQELSTSYDPGALLTPAEPPPATSTVSRPPPPALRPAPPDVAGRAATTTPDIAGERTATSQTGDGAMTATLSGTAGAQLDGTLGPAEPGRSGPRTAGGGARGGSTRTREREREADAVPEFRPRTPLTGSAPIRRDALQLSVSAPAYPGSARIAMQPAPTPAADKAERKSVPNMPDYRGEFAEAVAEGARLYDRILAEAREIASAAREQNDFLGRRHQQVLSVTLRGLGDRLDFDRTSLRIGRDTMLLRMHRQAGMLRMRISAAAGTAHGRLSAKRGRYQSDIDGLVGSGNAIVGRANAGVTAVDTKAKAAEFALDFMLGSIPRIYTLEGFAKWQVRNEAIQAYLPPRVTRLKTSIARQREAVVTSLTASFSCLQCNVDNSRQAFRYAIDSIEIPARRAIDAAAAGGRKSVNDAVEQLEAAILESHGRGDTALVQQHDAMRKSAIDNAQQQAKQERAELADAAARQVASLGAVAGGQAQSIHRVKATLEKDATLSEPSFAGVVSRASQRLSRNIAGVAAVHPRTTAEAARRLREGRNQRAAVFDRQQETTGAYTRRSLDGIVEQSLSSVERQVGQIMGGLTPVPVSVRDSANSSLEPLDDAFYNGLAEYRDSLATLSNSVDSAFTHQPAAAVTPSPRRATPPAPPAGRGRAAPTGAAAAPAVPVPGPPESCHGCPPPGAEASSAAATSSSADGPLVCWAEPNMSTAPPQSTLMSDAGGASTASAPNSTPAPAPTSPDEFNRSNDAIARNPFGVAAFSTFVDGVYDTIDLSIETRIQQIHTNMSAVSTNRKAIVDQLSGITKLQGKAIEENYNFYYDPDLRAALDSQLRSIWAAGGTDDANVGEAISALDGKASESGFSALTAAFNFSNDFDRARETLLNMTPQQIADMRRDHAAELTDFASQLYGQEREIFEALISGHPETARAIELRRDLDRNDYKQAEERGDANAALVDTALRERHTEAIYSGPGDHHRDVFGLEDPEIVAERSQAHLTEMQTAFGFLPGVIEMGGGTSSDMAGSALFHYASRTVDFNLDYYRRYPPPPGSPAERRMRELENQPNPYGRREMLPVHRLMIEQSLRHGPDSDEARGARLLRERRRSSGNPDPDGMDKALHIGTGDAREGGGYDAERRREGLEEANRRRAEVFLASERFRYQLEGGNPPPETAEEAQATVRAEIMGSYPRDARARAVVLGIVNSEEGDLDAVVEYAAHKEDTTLLNRYLGRRDRREIDAFTKRYNDTHSVSIEKRLGLFEHHWSMGNMNGAVFSGDTANTLEINWMGVPQNPQERGETALRVMDQTTEQAGALGTFFAAGEYAALEHNAARLRRAMGVTPDQVDSRGRIRVRRDPATGLDIQYGHFDANGNLRQEYAGDSHALAMAAGMARTYASSYTEATDRIASYITTALVVAAAIITTALTGGAAASIWIPMLVTAGAGLVGIGLTAAVKGGRYGRDDLVRDLAMTVVQTLTAGIGAAGSIAARGGMPALRAVASRGISQGFRISESALERIVVSKGGSLAASASLGAELGIGAASGALSGGVTAALDPANRGDHFWSRVAGGAARGAAGGAVGAGAARGVAAGIGAAGNRLASAASSRAAQSALASGLSREQAIQNALLAARRANWVTQGVTRAVAGGASGSASRMTELGLEGRMSLDQILAEGRSTFVQGMLQGALEHGVDPGHRNPFLRANARLSPAELSAMTSLQLKDHFHHVDAIMANVDAMYSRASEGSGSAPSRPAPPGATEPAGLVTTRLPDSEESGPRAPGRSPLTDETGPLGMPPHPGAEAPPALIRSAAGDQEEPVLRMRTASGGFDDGEVTDITERRTFAKHAESTEPNPPPFVDNVDFRPGMLDGVPELPAQTTIRGTDPKDPVQARLNYELMRAASPDREVLLAHNPSTGEYLVIQGWTSATEPPPGGWLTERHSHPKLSSNDRPEQFATILPSGIGGDFTVLQHELDRMAGGRTDIEFRHSSIIDIEINGVRTETHFSITKLGDNYSYSVRLVPPRHGVSEMGPFRSIREYAYEARGLTDGVVDFGLTPRAKRDPMARSEAGSGPVRSSMRRGTPVSEEDRGSAAHVAERMAASAQSETESRARADNAFDALLAPGTAASEAHAAVRRLGLVGERDSLARLTSLINDPDIPPAVRSVLANVTLEATRAELFRAGALAPGDDVLMLFRGVPAPRLTDYDKEGLNLARLGRGGDEDAGHGLYGSQDFESAARYTGSEGPGGQVLPLIVRRSELGNVIDVRSGTPMGDRWLQFLRASRGRARIFEQGYDHLSGVLYPGLPMKAALQRDGRGLRFEAFLRSVAADPSLPDAVRAAAADPHITLMDLGGVASTGNDRGVLTDQWAMHSQHIADLFNRAHDFPVPAETVRLAGGMLRNLAGGQHDTGGDLPALMRLAPESVTEFFADVVRGARHGETTTPTDAHLMQMTLEMRAAGAPPELVQTMRARLQQLANPEHPVYLKMVEVGAHSDFHLGMPAHLQQAFERRAAVEAARRFGYWGAAAPERQLVRDLLRRDQDAVVRLINSEGTDRERATRYAWERVRQGERMGDALRDGFALVRAVDSSAFADVQQRINDRLSPADRSPQLLADMVRDQPERLLHLAHTNPEQLTQYFADLVFKRMSPDTVDPLTADRFARYVGNRMISNVLPVASELSVVFTLREMGLTLLKADAAQRGGANRPGLDIVAFGRINGSGRRRGPVEVMIADDKAYRMRDALGINELQDVSAMTGPRFAENLRTTATEIRAQIARLEATPGLSRLPEYADYIGGARAAARQMEQAAKQIRRLPVPPTEPAHSAHIRSEAYTRMVAAIMAENHITQVVTSRHGNVNELARWLRSQGFLLEDEYLRRLAAMVALKAMASR